MGTSGTSAFTTTCNELIVDAARKVRAVRGTQTEMNADAMKQWRRGLNQMTKQWQGDGLHVWTVTEATLFPQAEQVAYGAGAGATDHITQTYVQTELSADEASGQTVLSIESTTGISNADNIGIVLDDGTIHWTTVSGAPSTTVTIASALTDSASSGNAVFAYTNKIVRPLKIVDARRHNIVSGDDMPIEMVSRRDYLALPQKEEPGTINQMFYDPQLGIGKLKLWQPPVAVEDLVGFTWWRPIEDFSAAGDNPDLPQEWIGALMWNLAAWFLPEYPLEPNVAQIIVSQAASSKESMMGFDRENESIKFGVDMGR
jgi:hypothetical protein